MRIDYAKAAPSALDAMSELDRYAEQSGLERSLLDLLKIRASQLNGCAFCLEMHNREAREAGEQQHRLDTLSAWREAPFFSGRERAALGWTEAVTLVSVDHVQDSVYEAARAEFSPQELVNLTMAVIAINGWNRLAIAFRSEVPAPYPPSGST